MPGKGTGSHGARVAGCELPDVVLGTKLESFARAKKALKPLRCPSNPLSAYFEEYRKPSSTETTWVLATPSFKPNGPGKQKSHSAPYGPFESVNSSRQTSMDTSPLHA